MNDQRPLTDQLKDLVTLANKNGLYDAADYIVRNALSVPRDTDRAATREYCLYCVNGYAHTDHQHNEVVSRTIHDMRSYEAALSTR